MIAVTSSKMGLATALMPLKVCADASSLLSASPRSMARMNASGQRRAGIIHLRAGAPRASVGTLIGRGMECKENDRRQVRWRDDGWLHVIGPGIAPVTVRVPIKSCHPGKVHDEPSEALSA